MSTKISNSTQTSTSIARISAVADKPNRAIELTHTDDCVDVEAHMSSCAGPVSDAASAADKSFQDVLAAMVNNSQLREQIREHVLDEKIAQLPLVVAKTQKHLDSLSVLVNGHIALTDSRFDNIESRLDSIESDIKDLKDGQVSLEGRMDRLEERMDRLEERVASLEQKVATLEQRMDRLEGRMDRLEQKVDQLQLDVSIVKTKVARMETNMSTMQTSINKLIDSTSSTRGVEYEKRAGTLARRLMSKHLGHKRMKVAYSRYSWHNLDLGNAVDDAYDDDFITEEEHDGLTSTDLILKGLDVYAVCEVSVTIHEKDVFRACKRAQVLEKIVQTPTRAVVVGDSITDKIAELADKHGVVFMMLKNRVESED